MRRNQIDLDLIRQAIKGNDLHLSLALVISVDIASDRSFMKANVQLLPNLYEARVRVGAEYVAPDVGIYFPLRPNDLVMVAFPSNDIDSGVLVKRLNSREDKIPEEFNNDKIVIKAATSEPVYIVADEIKIGSKDSDENLVLGQVFKSMMSSNLSDNASHKHIGNLGYFTFIPDKAPSYLSRKASPIDDETILSAKSFTEK